MNDIKMHIFLDAIKSSEESSDAVVKTMFSGCTNKEQLQNVYSGIKDAIGALRPFICNQFMKRKLGEFEDAEAFCNKWAEGRLDSLNTMYSEAEQRFAMTH